ncbi:hypothetical protein ACR2RY_001719 [Salmonella enterica]
MEEQANKILVELLQKAVGGIDAAMSFSQAQIPDVVHQLLIWNSASSFLYQLFVILLISGYFLSVKKLNSIALNESNSPEKSGLAVVGIGAGGIISLAFFVSFFFYFDWLKIWLAPKLYLLEYAASLIK